MTAAISLGWAIAIVLIVVGVWALFAPHALARHYGVSVEGHRETAYVRATGIRDVAIGVMLAATAYFRFIPLLVVIAALGIIVSLADLWLVSKHGGIRRPHAAHAIHGSGIVAFILIIAMVLFAIPR